MKLCYTRRVTDYLPCWPIALLVAAGIVLLALHRVLPGLVSAWAAAIALALSLVVDAALYWPLLDGPLSIHLYQWASFGGTNVSLVLRVDGLGYLFSLVALAAGGLATFFWAATSAAHVAGSRAASASQTLQCASVVGLVATVIMLSFAGNSLTLYLAWTAVGLCAFAVKMSKTGIHGELRSARNFLVVDQLAGYGILAALVALPAMSYPIFLPSNQPAVGAAVALLLLPALVRSLQYPFSKLVILAEPESPALGSLLQSLALTLSGTYLLVRLCALVDASGDAFNAILLVIGMASTAYGVLMALRESALCRAASWATVVELGLAVACFGIGSYGAVAAGLLLIVNHVLGRVALGLALAGAGGSGVGTEGGHGSDVAGPSTNAWPTSPLRNAGLAVAVVSVSGLPPFAGFWGRWMLAGVALAHEHLLLLLLTIISLAAIAWRMLRCFDQLLTMAGADGSGALERQTTWSLIGLAAPTAAMILAAVLPSLLVKVLVEPAARVVTTSGGPLASLALAGREDPLGGWLAVVALGLLLAATWFVWRMEPVPGLTEGRLKVSGWSPLSLDVALGLNVAVALGRLLASQIGLVRWLVDPERLCGRLWPPILGLGRALGLVAEGVEDRYYAPAMVVAAVVALFILAG